MAKQRIFSLDAVRGVSALLIVLYHVSIWQNRSLYDGGTFITQKFGIYMVELFYLLSGISMGYIYLEKFATLRIDDLKNFFIKRYFRIAPLYFLLCIFSIWAYHRPVNIDLIIRLLSNFSLLFGVVNPGYSMLTGGWSIGAEFFFYLFFPFMLFLAQKNRFWDAVILLTLLSSVVVVAIVVSRYSKLSDCWSIYSYPLNHFLFFWLGVLISRFRGVNNHWGYLVAGLLLFVFSGFLNVQTNDYSVGLVTGLNRLLLSVSVTLIVLYFYLKVKFKAEWLNHWSDWLASISFSVYLLHPFVYILTRKLLTMANVNPTFWQLYALVLIITIVLSRVTYHYEKYFVDLGNRLINKRNMVTN
ncbi:acyltransferase family protein [Solitalea lacus]|uniref:acyltransferase family protein n=1 Tax=Solitalea lacus TaxID=2911172 RepID=UPI001EDA7853|nr:acyltransferase [Solitalea lacus]UKJ09341.1 acyltransferase [Solitalea lacus]